MSAQLGNLMIDSSDAEHLRDFYAALTGWQKITIFHLPGIQSETGFRMLFNTEKDFVPCVWPETAGSQQKQMHLDFQVADIPNAVQQALSLGARIADQQYGGEEWTTMLDPDGHPFCLCRTGNPE